MSNSTLQAWQTAADTLPDFIGIGGQRCASSWLHKTLQIHPEIQMSSKKEVHFFDFKIRTESLDWYQAFFKQATNTQSIQGEITPTYSALFPEEVSIVKSLLPDIKMVFIIRNPVDRMISEITRAWTFSYLPNQAKLSKNIFALLRQVDSPLFYRLTDYATTYKNWCEQYGTEQIFVEKYDDVLNDSNLFLANLGRFLGLSGFDFPQSARENRKNKSKTKNEIPSMLRWYLAVEWLPKVKQLNQTIPLDFSDWIAEMEATKAKSKPLWYVIRSIHKAYFQLPYGLLYRLLNPIRIKRRVRQIEHNIGLS